VPDPNRMVELLSIGTSQRCVKSTAMNTRSSRSHTVFIVNLEAERVDGSRLSSRMNIVDLAGTERSDKASGSSILEEAKSINQSILCLGTCIRQINTNIVSYRDSNLTKILRDTFGGNALSSVLCTCSRKAEY